MKQRLNDRSPGPGPGGPYCGLPLYGQWRAGMMAPAASAPGEGPARFAATVDVMATDAALARARNHRGRIVCLLKYLAEIDDVTAEEPDQSVMPELAQLFLDIAEAAEGGAAEMLSISHRARPAVR